RRYRARRGAREGPPGADEREGLPRRPPLQGRLAHRADHLGLLPAHRRRRREQGHPVGSLAARRAYWFRRIRWISSRTASSSCSSWAWYHSRPTTVKRTPVASTFWMSFAVCEPSTRCESM